VDLVWTHVETGSIGRLTRGKMLVMAREHDAHILLNTAVANIAMRGGKEDGVESKGLRGGARWMVGGKSRRAVSVKIFNSICLTFCGALKLLSFPCLTLQENRHAKDMSPGPRRYRNRFLFQIDLADPHAVSLYWVNYIQHLNINFDAFGICAP
jgi:hypothetical protein